MVPMLLGAMVVREEFSSNTSTQDIYNKLHPLNAKGPLLVRCNRPQNSSTGGFGVSWY